MTSDAVAPPAPGSRGIVLQNMVMKAPTGVEGETVDVDAWALADAATGQLLMSGPPETRPLIEQLLRIQTDHHKCERQGAGLLVPAGTAALSQGTG